MAGRSNAHKAPHRSDSPISPREASLRFLGVGALVLIAYLHLMDISHKIEEGVWYMAFLFSALIALCLALAVALVRTDSSGVRFVWVGAAGLAVGALFGFCASRVLPLPGMADHHGDWLNTLGIFAGLLELGLIALAGFALRDRVRRQARRRTRRRARSAAPALGALTLLLVQPALALAHGDEETGGDEMTQGAMGNDSGAMAGTGHEAMGQEPLLGSTELGIAFLAALAFVGWAGMRLRTRAARPSERTRGRPQRRGRVGAAALTAESHHAP